MNRAIILLLAMFLTPTIYASEKADLDIEAGLCSLRQR